MFRIILIFLCFCSSLQALAQASRRIVLDSLLGQKSHIFDATTEKESKAYEALMLQYEAIERTFDSLAGDLHNKVDNLGGANLPYNHLQQKIDSLKSAKEERLSVIKNNFETLKSNAIGKINSLNLPPELGSHVEEYTSAINKLDLSLPTTNLQLPSLTFNNSLDLPIPDLENPLLESFPNLSAANIPVGDEISKATSQLQLLNQSIPKDIPTVDLLGKTAESQISKIDEISAVQDQLGNLPSAPITSEEQAKQELLKQAQDVAVDHFAGKEEELKSAMGQISKYKKKFPNVNNLEELAQLIKKRPNEMRGKPLIERIVPGVAFQLQKKNELLFVDLNPYAGYRFTGKLTAGLGWNQRVSYDLKHNAFNNDSRVYGPRVFGEYKLWKGFSPRLEVETMNTFVPPYIKVSPADLGQKEWVWGVFAGMKKDYKFFKKINGTALIMFRLFDPNRKSPYADVVNARFGFEFPMKKKANKN